MGMYAAQQINPPESWKEFEKLCCALWRKKLKSDDVKLNGRQGEDQDGIDIIGTSFENTRYGVQCKLVNGDKTVPFSILTQEIEKAKVYKDKIDVFILCTNGKISSRFSKKFSEAVQNKEFPFEVIVKTWGDLIDEICLHHDIISDYFPHLGFSNDLKYLRKRMYKTDRMLLHLIDMVSKLDKRLTGGKGETLDNYMGDIPKELADYVQFIAYHDSYNKENDILTVHMKVLNDLPKDIMSIKGTLEIYCMNNLVGSKEINLIGSTHKPLIAPFSEEYYEFDFDEPAIQNLSGKYKVHWSVKVG